VGGGLITTGIEKPLHTAAKRFSGPSARTGCQRPNSNPPGVHPWPAEQSTEKYRLDRAEVSSNPQLASSPPPIRRNARLTQFALLFPNWQHFANEAVSSGRLALLGTYPRGSSASNPARPALNGVSWRLMLLVPVKHRQASCLAATAVWRRSISGWFAIGLALSPDANPRDTEGTRSKRDASHRTWKTNRDDVCFHLRRWAASRAGQQTTTTRCRIMLDTFTGPERRKRIVHRQISGRVRSGVRSQSSSPSRDE
jgi:hypothetical protein